MQIAVFSTKPYDREYLDKHNETEMHGITYFEMQLNSTTADLTKGFNVVCVFVNDKVDNLTIDKLSKNGVKLIALRCAGFNNIDLEAAKMNGIKVVRVPAYSPEAVAEHAVALILTLNRKTHKAYNRIREGNFSLDRLVGFNLHNKVVGVIGTGQIGKAFARIMLGFGTQVLAYDIAESEELKHMGVQYKPLPELFKEAEIISLHCPLNPSTYHLIDRESFTLMKDGVMLINTSRGALVNTPDIIEALKNKKIGFLGIDVYEQEENIFFKDLSENLIEDDDILRLISFPNVLITSHQAFLTKEALNQIASTTFKNIADFEGGRVIENEIR